MRYFPSYAEFTELARKGNLVPVYRQLVGDTLTPVSAFRKIQEGDWAFLFESVVGGERVGRYSFLGSAPFLRFEAYGTRVVTWSRPAYGGEQSARAGKIEETTHVHPLKLLAEKLSAYRTPPVPGLPRFTGGAVGYAGYDTVRYEERLPNAPLDDRQLPDLCFALYDHMVIFDHITKTIAVVAHARIDAADLEGCYRRACAEVDRLVDRLQQGVADLSMTDIAPVGETRLAYTSNFAPGAYQEAVAKGARIHQGGRHISGRAESEVEGRNAGTAF